MKMENGHGHARLMPAGGWIDEGVPERRMQIVTTGDIVVELLPIPAGSFLMGSDNPLFSEAPVHAVTFRSGFLLGKYPITQAQWQAVMRDNPSAFLDSPNHPVESINWDQAWEFCRRLGAQSGQRVRLPSEAEWEYACRAGITGEFFFGPWGSFRDDSEIPLEVRKALCDYAWFDLNSGDRTHPVGLKRPNPWGLYDMVGNVWEWCADVWHNNYVGAPQDGSAWLEGEERQPRRCLRGGGVDGAIRSAGGAQILAECEEIRRTRFPQGLPTGEAVLTSGGLLPARYVIHTVGPIKGLHGARDAELLAACYRNSLILAVQQGLRSVAFPAISTGIYGYPREEAAEISSRAIAEFLGKDQWLKEVRLVFFSESDARVFLRHQRFGNVG